MVMSTATTTPQINNLFRWMRKNNRAARFLIGEIPCRSLPNDKVLITTRARKSFILCLYMKTIRAKQARVHLFFFFYNVTNLE